MTRTALYRVYDDTGALLYVGIARNLARRWSQHAGEKEWWDRIKRQTVIWYDTRDEARREEIRAILTERPAFNIVNAPAKPRVRVPVQRGWPIPDDVGDLC